MGRVMRSRLSSGRFNDATAANTIQSTVFQAALPSLISV